MLPGINIEHTISILFGILSSILLNIPSGIHFNIRLNILPNNSHIPFVMHSASLFFISLFFQVGSGHMGINEDSGLPEPSTRPPEPANPFMYPDKCAYYIRWNCRRFCIDKR